MGVWGALHSTPQFLQLQPQRGARARRARVADNEGRTETRNGMGVGGGGGGGPTAEGAGWSDRPGAHEGARGKVRPRVRRGGGGGAASETE